MLLVNFFLIDQNEKLIERRPVRVDIFAPLSISCKKEGSNGSVLVQWYYSTSGQLPVTSLVGTYPTYHIKSISEISEGFYFCYWEKLIEIKESIEPTEQFNIARTQFIVYGMLLINNLQIRRNTLNKTNLNAIA